MLEGGDLFEAFGIFSFIRDGVFDARDVLDIYDIFYFDVDIYLYMSGYNNIVVMGVLMGMCVLRFCINDGA